MVTKKKKCCGVVCELSKRNLVLVLVPKLSVVKLAPMLIFLF